MSNHLNNGWFGQIVKKGENGFNTKKQIRFKKVAASLKSEPKCIQTVMCLHILELLLLVQLLCTKNNCECSDFYFS